jgi:hypothetical protein
MKNIVEAYVGAQRKAIEEDKAMIGKISGLDVLPKSFESDFKKAYEEAEGTYGTVRSGCVELGGTDAMERSKESSFALAAPRLRLIRTKPVLRSD